MTFSNEVIKSPYDIRDYTITAEADLPKSFSLETVPVKNQGFISSCVAHALASVIEWHYQRQHQTYEEFSTDFIYGIREDGDYIGDGMVIRQALKNLQKYGDVPYSECPGNHKYKEAMENVTERMDDLVKLAHPHCISAYFKIRNADELKTALMKYGVVVVSMNVHDINWLMDDVYKYVASTKSGRHCVFIYGWDEKGWLVQNSWGKLYGWDGRFIIPFDFELNEMWGIVDDIIEPQLNKPKRNNILDIIYKIINAIVNALNALQSN